MPFILLGNIASSLKFELISRKIKLVFLYAMELDTRELFRCLARDCNYRDENYVMFQKRIALHETIYCSQSSEALGGFWSFLKLYLYIQIETFMYAITSHKKRRAKYQTEMLYIYRESRNTNSGIFPQPCFLSVLELSWGYVTPEICKVSSRTLESPSLPIFEGLTCGKNCNFIAHMFTFAD